MIRFVKSNRLLLLFVFCSALLCTLNAFIWSVLLSESMNSKKEAPSVVVVCSNPQETSLVPDYRNCKVVK